MFETFWKKVLRRKPYSWLVIPAAVFWFVSVIYRLFFHVYRLTRTRATRLNVPVVSVGSIMIGGAGKTPLVEVIARGLQGEGVRVGVVSSGYGRSSREPLLLPGYKLQRIPADMAGDEMRELSGKLPEAIFSIARSKTDAARALAGSGNVDVIVVDDGFQHFTLFRDIDVVAYDASFKPGHLRLFPSGVLRESVRALRRADMIIMTRAKFAKDIAKLRRRLGRVNPGAEVYHAGFVPEVLVSGDKSLPVKYIEDKSVFLFAGVGNFSPLRKQVAALAGDLDYALELTDHQVYDEGLLRRIKAMAGDHGSDVILTTGKDWVKLGDFDFGREIYYLGVSVDLDPGEEKLIQQIMQKIQLERPGSNGQAI
ncbi:MAG TPA: tetraacyldisaccharide 4'-kinase [Acidobacteriota bacterium]|nr:tetraacyldisaccharide 4'-kinase [Acidobacteriota bacterium]